MHSNSPSCGPEGSDREENIVAARAKQKTERLLSGNFDLPRTPSVGPNLLDAVKGDDPELDSGEQFPADRHITKAQRIVTEPISHNSCTESALANKFRECATVLFFLLDRAGWLSRLIAKVRGYIQKKA